MRQHGIVHPEMMERVRPNFYPSLCTIREASATQDAYGQIGEGWNDLPGHVGLPCRVAPKSAQERRSAEQIYVNATHHIALPGFYPAIEETMSAVVDGVTYGIEAVEWDGNSETTRLFVRVIE